MCKRRLAENKPENVMNWYQRKNLYLACNKKIDDRFFSRKLIADLTKGFASLAPLYRFLWKIRLDDSTSPSKEARREIQ